MVRCYSELIQLPTFEERFRYLKLDGKVCDITFGFDRYFNQRFYNSKEWKTIRRDIVVRDNGCDLGCDDSPIYGKIFIHHMNPITIEDISKCSEFLMDPEYLVCVSFDTHNAIHYGCEDILDARKVTERKPNDTCPWKNGGVL
jgi:hypothetical protein